MRNVALIAGLLLVAAGTNAGAAPGSGCASAGKTVIRSSVARIYDHAGSNQVFGCWLPSGKRVRLDVKAGRWRLANVNGRYVAVVFERTGGRKDVIVWAKLGPSPARMLAYTFPGHSDPPAQQLYVSKLGAVAFSVATTIGYIPPVRADQPPTYKELDSGPGVSARSLWANQESRKLLWLNGKVRKTAPWR
jgi:hypothetical protein